MNINYTGLKCTLKRGEWIDEKVICDVTIIDTGELKDGISAYGNIKTSKPIPVEGGETYQIITAGEQPEPFELLFQKKSELIKKQGIIGIRISELKIEDESKKNASFKSMGAIQNKKKRRDYEN